ncbi:SUKH-4 immunity protein-domain-containing protein [Aspergillus alliaceus]|uniref:SUKH-4 immunity protein-domain-containing protein n=1 Tax=Petromyces alliaceus TaxID=209559 RepID=UPI0012A4D048|nr:SUKH-4 immunity protein-domain-containing protein [Aspergillus alliaceus]KAB8233574.1 SUKH-4 immunity protein-domain-containing protein [Aspergillus alliaceus]
MPGFLSLPPEIILWVYCSLDSIADAYFLSQTCKQAYHVFSRLQSQPKIFESIINNAIQGAAPTQSWLEAQFGPGSLWRPKEADLPVDLTDKAAREFLLNIGFPSIKLPRMGFESTHLREFAPGGCSFYGYTGEELYGIHDPEDEVPALSFCFGEINSQLVMLVNENGRVFFYNPDSYDYLGRDRGPVARRLDSLAVLLGMVVAVTKDLREAPSDISLEELERRVEILKRPLDVLREKMRRHDLYADEDAEFWNDIFSDLLDDWDLRD